VSGATNFWIRWRVRVGYPVGIAAFWFAHPQLKWLFFGVGIASVGLLIRGYAAGTSANTSTWQCRALRLHAKPVVSGSMLLAAGFSVASHSWISTSLLAAYLIVFYPVVIRREQTELKTLYGNAFDEYASRYRHLAALVSGEIVRRIFFLGAVSPEPNMRRP